MKLSHLIRRDPAAPTLRERAAGLRSSLTDAKRRAILAVKVGRIAYQPPAPEPEPVDRVALVNYATWLFMERRMACGELYPNAGPNAEIFVAAALAADRFHFPASRSWRDVPPPSTRAARILDLVGVDWRADRVGGNTFDPPFYDAPSSHGWPALDGALVAAFADLQRLNTLLATIRASDGRTLDELPEYRALDEARDEAIDTLANVRAKGLLGLQAKARAILSDGFRGDDDTPLFIARGLARDLIDAPRNAIEPRPDPIHAVVEEGRRLLQASRDAHAVPVVSIDPAPEKEDAQDAAWDHFRGPLVSTVPTTARGCADLARYVGEFKAFQGVDLDEEQAAILANIARSPLL